MRVTGLAISLLVALHAWPVAAQTTEPVVPAGDRATAEQVLILPTSSLPSPILIPIAGSVLKPTGEPRTGQATVRLSLYESQDDPNPIWTEDQLVTLGVGGTYQLWFGGTSSEGLPTRLFTEHAARWVGVTIDQDPELPRSILVANPYAARAASADTLGAKTASAFVLSENLAQILDKWGFEPSKPPKSPGGPEVLSLSTGDTTTPNALAKYLDNIGTLGQAATVFESGGFLGVGTANPVARLTVGDGTQNDATPLFVNSFNTNPAMELRMSRSVGAFRGPLMLFTGTTSDSGPVVSAFAQIFGYKENATQGNTLSGLRFDTNNGAGLNAALTINSAGNVGVGTTAPGARLHVIGDGGLAANLRNSDATNGYGVSIESEGTASTRYALTVRNLAGDNTYFHISTESGRVGNVGIGTTNPSQKLHVAGSIAVDGNINAKYQDVAEWVDTPVAIEAGTVVIVDPDRNNNVIAASVAYDTRVAGAVSRQPGLVLGEATPNGSLVAQSGRVRIKVDARYGAINIGDLLVTSPTPGHAMISKPIKIGGAKIHRPGTVLGKALEALPNGRGEILVLLTLQ